MPPFGRPPNWVSHEETVHRTVSSPVLILGRQKDFVVCGRRFGALPQDPATFLKKGRSKTFDHAYRKLVRIQPKGENLWKICTGSRLRLPAVYSSAASTRLIRTPFCWRILPRRNTKSAALTSARAAAPFRFCGRQITPRGTSRRWNSASRRFRRPCAPFRKTGMKKISRSFGGIYGRSKKSFRTQR